MHCTPSCALHTLLCIARPLLHCTLSCALHTLMCPYILVHSSSCHFKALYVLLMNMEIISRSPVQVGATTPTFTPRRPSCHLLPLLFLSFLFLLLLLFFLFPPFSFVDVLYSAYRLRVQRRWQFLSVRCFDPVSPVSAYVSSCGLVWHTRLSRVVFHTQR